MRIILFFLLLKSFNTFSQDTLMPNVILDDVIIFSDENGFTVEDFVKNVRTDTTFYMGFKNLRYYSHNYTSELLMLDKKGNRIASQKRKGYHFSNGKYAFLDRDSIYDQHGMLTRSGKYKFYTPEAFDEVFFPSDTLSVDLNISKIPASNESKNMRDAKNVVFSIGTDNIERSSAGLSRKLAIFDLEMQKYYDYVISDTLFNNYNCYVFEIRLKESLSENEVNETLVKNIITYFDKKNLNVLYREYKFKYKNLLIDLDIFVKVKMDYFFGKHIPVFIYYKGYWDFPLVNRETAIFRLINTNFIFN